jgi:hypothetical protein
LLVNINVSPNKSSDSSVNIFSALLTTNDINDLENDYNKNDERQDVRQHVTKLTDVNDFAFSIDSASLSRAFPPKRSHSTSDSSSSISKEQTPKTSRQKKLSLQ